MLVRSDTASALNVSVEAVTIGGVRQLSRRRLLVNVSATVPGDERTAYAELARVLRGLSEAYRMPLDIHVYTDLQKSGMPARFADLQLPADAKSWARTTIAQNDSGALRINCLMATSISSRAFICRSYSRPA